MRHVPPSFDPEAVARIDGLLDDFAENPRVNVPLAIESGSRAWGFPSPDSDYDCRFLYVRSVTEYLSPWPSRDVIESPPDGILDVNGWDLRKALQLLVMGNAAVLEWLRSPITYRSDETFRRDMLELAERVSNRSLVGSHYLHVGRTQWKRFADDGGQVPLKKVFYALRPALALRWMREHPASAVPPMQIQQLVDETGLPAAVAAEIGSFVALKATTREMGTGKVPAPIHDLIRDELVDEEWLTRRRPAGAEAAARRDASQFFHDAVHTHGLPRDRQDD